MLGLLVLGAIVAVVAVALTRGESEEGSEETLAQNVRLEHEGPGGTETETEEGEGEEALAESQHQNSPGDLGGEAPREGPRSPVGELVEDRAYPKSYVSDRLAIQGSRAFDRLPSSAPRSAFKSDADFRAAGVRATRSWKALGPVTPDVAPEATQFFNIETGVGTPTTNSGRVTAMAIDPKCGKRGHGCRIWVAAAGGGIWRTPDALADDVKWRAPSEKLPTNSFGSLFVDPNDPSGDTIYAGSGEPNGSSDSEAGLGLFKSTDGGRSWHLVKGSRPVAIDRSIGAIEVKPGHPNTIYIGTDVARHGSSSVNGGRRTPPNAPALGVYKSTGRGRHFRLLTDLQRQTPANSSDPAAGQHWFQGGINRLELDPANPRTVYAAVFGYGLWRSKNGGKTWKKVFHTVNETDFSDPSNPGDTFGDRTEFDLVRKDHHTRVYVGDSSDDLGIAEIWRVESADTKMARQLVGPREDNAGWTKLSSSQNGTNGFLAYYYCQNGQCGYDNFVVSPPKHPGQLWLGGAMNYDELPLYGGQPPRSNGRTVVRSTNAGAQASRVTWQDMTQDARPPGATEGMHPDQHAIVFDPKNPGIAFVGSDGGVIRVHVKNPVDTSSECAQRSYDYGSGEQPLEPADLKDCQRLLSGIPRHLDSLNSGLNTIQFQSLSVNPNDPTRELLGGTQDNGTFNYTGNPTWTEVIGGDGAQSGFNPDDGRISYHTYYDATPGVNFDNNDPAEWYDTYDPLVASPENRSFYVPFIPDPNVGGRLFLGMQHVWRTNDNGGQEAYLKAHCSSVYFDPNRPTCGDWQPIGQDLTSPSFGNRAGEYVVATTRAPSDDRTLWAGTRIGRLFVSKNADASPSAVDFNRIDTNSTPGRFLSGIAVDPHDPNHAFVSYSGYNVYTPGTPGHVFDVHYDPATGKATFNDISHNLGDQPVTGIAFHPQHAVAGKGGRGASPGDLYVATDFGVSRLPAGATEWEDAAPGLPAVAVYGLTLSEEADTLYAATHGRGAYALKLP